MEVTETTAAQDNTAAVAGTETVETTTQSATETAEVGQEGTKEVPASNNATTTEKVVETHITGAPETYAEFAMPEGIEAPTEDFKAFAKEQGFTQEQAQANVNFFAEKVVPMMQARQEEQVTKWTNDSTTKYGKEGIDAANKALSRFSTPEFTAFLKETGLGNHPEMIGIFHSINSKISEDGIINSGFGAKPKSLGQVFYPNMKK